VLVLPRRAGIFSHAVQGEVFSCDDPSHFRSPSEDEEEVVRVFVLLPDELALDLDYADVVLVDAGDDLRSPVLSERAELLGEVDFLVNPILL
jgi:hypothetical protein